MSYIENPKTKGSGIICGIPQQGFCPVGCPDCFFQGGRSYLEPFEKNLPNMPTMEEATGKVVRVNDGNDSNNQRDLVMSTTARYPQKFYNTSIPKDLEEFGDPVVLSVNPGGMTDRHAHLVDPIPRNLMFVRVRTNTWNLELVDRVVGHYSPGKIPIILTFMAYYTESIPDGHKEYYSYRKRTMNSYWVITQEAWNMVVNRYTSNSLVYTCGKDANTFACYRCGNCIREYFATMERMKVK